MAIGRWDPFRGVWTLRDTLDRLVYDNVVRPTSGLLSGGRSYLPVDVIERDDRFLLRATMPDIDPDDVQITLTGTSVMIRGESRREEEQQEEGQSWIVRERRDASYYRSVTLPAPIDADRAEARYEHGVLTLTLPKAQEAQPRQVRIGSSRQPTRDTRTPPRQSDQPASEPASPRPPGPPPAPQADLIDEASQQSFPASDPPAYYSTSQ